MKYEKLYKKLRKEYTDEEIAAGYLIPEELTEAAQLEAQEEFRKLRFQRLQEMSEEQRLMSDLMRLQFQLEDYLKQDAFSEQFDFGQVLEEYIRILKKKKKDFAQDIGIHYTRLSRILNGRETPNMELAYRLEKHSGQLIPALTWWRLVAKKQEYLLKMDEKTRRQEAGQVKNFLEFSA